MYFKSFLQRLENLENKCGHGTVKEHEKESWNFVISHGILSILPHNFTKFVPFSPDIMMDI